MLGDRKISKEIVKGLVSEEESSVFSTKCKKLAL